MKGKRRSGSSQEEQGSSESGRADCRKPNVEPAIGTMSDTSDSDSRREICARVSSSGKHSLMVVVVVKSRSKNKEEMDEK